MATRRKELEEKQRKEEQKKQEDAQRLKNQNKLKERVINSKYLVDNKNELEEKKKKKTEEHKQTLRSKKKSYDEELQRRLQKVYNRPLMFEQETKTVDKLKAARRAKQAIEEDADGEDGEYVNAEMTNTNNTRKGVDNTIHDA